MRRLSHPMMQMPVLVLALCCCRCSAAAAEGARQLLTGSYLLADGEVFEHMDRGIEAQVQRPEKVGHGPVIGPDFKWEATMHMYGSVVVLAPDDHRVYYGCNMQGSQYAGAPDGLSSCCVAVSKDGGNTFTKPMMPHVPFRDNGTTTDRTNMVFTSTAGLFDSMLLLPNGMQAPIGSPAGTRFLLSFDNGQTDTQFRSLQLAASPDGYNFTVLTPPPSLPENFADTSVSLTFDPLTRAFVAFGRLDGAPNQHPGTVCGSFPPPKNWNMKSVRGVVRASSAALPCVGAVCGPASLQNFSLDHPLPFSFDELDEQCLDVYNTAATVVSSTLQSGGRTGNYTPHSEAWGENRAFMAFPSVFLHYGEEENNGVLDVRFAFSRDGVSFRYINGDRRAFIPRGIAAPSPTPAGFEPSLFGEPDGGMAAASWDSGLVYAYRGLADHPSDGTQSLYYFGQQGSHARQSGTDRGVFGIGRLRVVRDRWVALGADSPYTSAQMHGSTLPLNMGTVAVLLPRCASGQSSLRMTLNTDVSVGGNLTIALLPPTTNTTAFHGFSHDDCLPIVGNRLAAPLRFRRASPVNSTAELGELAGIPIRLEFRLRPPARVFAWRFHCTL